MISTLFAGAFLSGYMSVFGYSFLLIFEPSDYLKIIIISGAAIFSFSAIAYLIIKGFENFMFYIRQKGPVYKVPTYLFLLALCALFIYNSSTSAGNALLFINALFVAYSIIDEQILPEIKNTNLRIGVLLFQFTLLGGQLFNAGMQAGIHVMNYGNST